MKKIISQLSVAAAFFFVLCIPAVAANRIPGDVNGSGEVLADDARLALRASARLQYLDDDQRNAADVDLDGYVLAADARQILRCSARLQTGFYYAAPADRGSYALFEPLIRNYGRTRVERAARTGYTIGAPAYDYAIRDINHDGTDELVIREYDGAGDYYPGAIYTLDGNRPVELYFIERHGSCYIMSDGCIVYSYKWATVQRIVGTQLITVAESGRYASDYHEEEMVSFLGSNGFSTDQMMFFFSPFNG